MSTRCNKFTPLFARYVAWLVMRLLLFAASVWLLATDPGALDMRNAFGIDKGLTFCNLVFCLLAADLVSKLRPHANIAMGSRKQFGEFHVPTPRLFPGGIRELTEHATRLLAEAPRNLGRKVRDAYEATRRAVQETAQGIREASRQAVFTIDVLRVLPWPEEDLTADELLREDLRRSRQREIVPVIAFWVVFNVAVALLLDRFGLLSDQTRLVWCLFYFLFDMVCVVLWCPLQLVLMRNRCCTTCQIFNWDGIMTVTPLLFSPCWFSVPLVLLALVVLARWELAFLRHPERFDERTNASLMCANCKDRLCALRGPLGGRARSNEASA